MEQISWFLEMIVFIVFTVHSNSEATQWNTNQLAEPFSQSEQKETKAYKNF